MKIAMTVMTTMMMVTATIAATAAPAHAGGADVTVGAGLLPGGDMMVMLQGERASRSLETGFALGGDVGGFVRPGLRVAAAGQFLTGLRAEDVEMSDKQILLGLRVEGHKVVGTGVRLYAYGTPAYARLMFASGDLGGVNGFALGGGIGGRIDLTDELQVFTELGYQWSTHKLEVPGPDPRLDLSFVTLRAGLGLAL